MVICYLIALCVISAINIIVLTRINHGGQRGPYFAICFAAFISCVGHLFLALSTNVGEAILANKMNYVAAVFLPMFTFNAVVAVCGIRVPSWASLFLYLMSFLIFGLSATVGFSDIYYTSIEYVQTYGVGNYVATYGPGHTLFNIMLVGYVVANVSLIIFSFAKKKNVSYKSLIALSLIEVVSIGSFVLARFMETDTLIMPAVYVFDQFALLYICFRVRYYDITQNVVNALEENNTDGYISVFSDFHFLGANKIAYGFFQELRRCRVDKVMSNNSEMELLLINWIKDFESGKKIEYKEVSRGKRHYKLSLKVLRFAVQKAAYLFKVEDDTEIYNYVRMLGNSNSRLESLAKTNATQIHAIQEQMVVGMANMVESRDSNTGGHIKRTSQVVAILVDELRKDPDSNYSDKFYDALIKSAPMHDLGKIAIDDAILRKPGRFTPEEYEIMKTHPSQGAAIVENLLSQIEDPSFVQIARNVAWFHHEHFNGKGYPNGLRGAEIPFEARVMAVADVYDALVSKRCYKDKFSFEKAYDIIIEGMGSQFDPSLKVFFDKARPRLEEYYKSMDV